MLLRENVVSSSMPSLKHVIPRRSLPRYPKQLRPTGSKSNEDWTGNPREANKARVILKDLLGPIQMCPGPDGSLWAEFYARPAALVKKAVGTGVGSDGSGGSLRPLATAPEPIAVLEVPLIAARI